MRISELRCKRCKEIKPIEEYNRGFFNKKGYDVYCHDCRMELNKITSSIVEKRCRQCGRILDVSEFGKNASTRDGYFKECLACQEENLHRRRERKLKGIWNGEMGTCSSCGMLKPTYDLLPPRFEKSKTRYCRSCFNKSVHERIQKYEHRREEQGWALQKRCKGCGRVHPSDSFNLDRRKKDGFSDLCDTCTDERITNYHLALKEKHKKMIFKRNAMKECHICHNLKPLSSFTKNETTVDGHSDMCVACARVVREEYARAWSQLRQEKGMDIDQMQCHSCGRTLPIEMFTRTKERKKGYRYICKDCSRVKDARLFQQWNHERKKAQFEFSLDIRTEKACKRCGRILPLTDFWARQASKDGYSHYCKACENDKKKIWRQEVRERGFPEERIPAEKQCGHCKRILPQVMFYRDAASATGLDSRCIECRKSYDRQYRARSEVKLKQAAYKRRPDVMEKGRIRARMYQQRPEVKERVRAYRREYKKRPYVMEKRRTYDRIRYQRTDVKQKKKERDAKPEAKARRRKSTHAWYMRKKAERENRASKVDSGEFRSKNR
jgi:hypothetical protein